MSDEGNRCDEYQSVKERSVGRKLSILRSTWCHNDVTLSIISVVMKSTHFLDLSWLKCCVYIPLIDYVLNPFHVSHTRTISLCFWFVSVFFASTNLSMNYKRWYSYSIYSMWAVYLRNKKNKKRCSISQWTANNF